MKQLTISGKTYDFRESLRTDGFRWNPERKVWTRNFADDDTKLQALKNACEENGLFTEIRNISNPNERKYLCKESYRFNLESMSNKLHCIEYDLDDGKLQFPIEIANTKIHNWDEFEALREECQDLCSKASWGKVTGKEYGRIKEIVEWRVMQRYLTCIASGMDEAKAGVCFEDM